MNGPAVASSGRARRTGRREMASISAVYYTRGAGEGIRRGMSGVTRSSDQIIDPGYSKSWSEIGCGRACCLIGTSDLQPLI